MRVVAGELRGRRLVAPDLATLRPTSDRVREAIFDILFSLGGVEGWRVADLYAGSGALGIEALSRGATSATFVEHDRRAVAAIRRNLAAVGLADAEASGVVTVVQRDATDWAASTAARFDLAICDPPYGFVGWAALLASLPADLAVLESSSEVAVPPGWSVLRTRRYGGTLVTVLEAVADDPLPAPGSAESNEEGAG